MRSKWLVGIMLAVTVFCLAGCGVKDKKEIMTNKVSGDFGKTLEERREAKFKADIEEGETTLSKHCLYSSNDEYITRWNREGKKLGRIRKKGYSVETCSDNRLICSKWTSDEECKLYSIPIKQTESGEDVLWDKEEVVAHSTIYLDDGVFLCEPYLIYTEVENTLTRINLESKEKKTMKFDMGVEWIDTSSLMDGLLYLVEGQYSLGRQGKERGYCIRIDDWKSEKFYEKKKSKGEIQMLCVEGQLLYLVTGANLNVENIECYDMKQKKVVGRLSLEEIDSLLQKEGVIRNSVLGNGAYIDAPAIYAYQGRLYLSMCIEDGQRDNRFALLSCRQKDMSDLRYEREISEWWFENCDVYKDDEGVEYSGYFWGACEDVFYFTYEDKQKHKEHLMCYHMDTKKWEEVPENDLVYLAYMEIGCVGDEE